MKNEERLQIYLDDATNYVRKEGKMTDSSAINSIAEQDEQTAHNRQYRIVSILLAAGFLSLTAFCILLFLTEGRVRPTWPQESAVRTESPVRWEVERLYYDENTHYYTIDGWAFIPGEEIFSYNCHVLLQDIRTGSYLQLPGMQAERQDLTERFPELADFDQPVINSGFRSIFQRNKLDGALEYYKIYIQYCNNNHNILIDTQRYLNQF